MKSETRIFECPVGDCSFKGTQAQIDQHQLSAHLALFQKEIDYRPFADQQ